MNTIRCSSLPLAWVCPSSQELPPDAPRINQSDEPAELGNAAHRWLAAHVKGTDLDIDQIAAEHACDADELKMLCAQGAKALAKLAQHFHAADEPMRVEVPMVCDTGEALITGTADLLARQGTTALIGDWKSGRVESDFRHQLMGYSLCALRHFELKKRRIDDVTIITIWLREGVWDVERFTRDQILSWADELRRRIKNGRGNFNPGGHCQYCPRAIYCDARRALVRSTIADLSVEGVKVVEWTSETRELMGETIGEMFNRAKLVERAAEDFRATLKADIALHGALPIGGGRQLALTAVNKRVLDPAKARPVLAQWLSPDEIDEQTTISVSGCESAAVAKAAKGQGAATKRAMAAALEDAGAVSVNPTYQLREGKALEEAKA